MEMLRMERLLEHQGVDLGEELPGRVVTNQLIEQAASPRRTNLTELSRMRSRNVRQRPLRESVW